MGKLFLNKALAILMVFRHLRPPEETARATAAPAVSTRRPAIRSR